jgi:hypothetical protein
MNLRAQKYFHNAEPILAACCYLAINDAQKAVQMLMRGNEVELAYAVSKLLKVSIYIYIIMGIIHIYASMCLPVRIETARMSLLHSLASARV